MKMSQHSIELQILPGDYSVLKYPVGTVLSKPLRPSLYKECLTPEELSVVCEASSVQPGYEKAESGWRGLRVVGSLDFALTGVLASIARPLAEAEISIFAISTFDTDYILVKNDNIGRAQTTLENAGFKFR